jgi:hypothetical protein
MIRTSFATEATFLRKLSVSFNTLLPTLNKTLHTTVVKFPASTSDHITSGARKLTNCDNASAEFVLLKHERRPSPSRQYPASHQLGLT